MHRIGSNARRRRVGAAALIAGAGLLATGCSGTPDSPGPAASPAATAPSTSGPATASGTPAPTGTTAAGKPVDGESLNQAMTTAIAKAGGCEMKATVGAVSMSGSFAFGPRDEVGFISEVYGRGSLTSGDGSTARYHALTGQRIAGGGFYIDDGTPIQGRTWARVPRFGSALKDPETLIKEHPLYLLVPEAVQIVQPDNITSLIAVKKGAFEAPDSGAGGGRHYVWTVDGKTPVQGAENTYEVWTDAEGLPTRFTGTVRGAALDARYTRWGEQVDERTPAAKDTVTLPLAD